MRKFFKALIVLGVIFGVSAAWVLLSGPPNPQPVTVTPAYPSNLHFVAPNQCVGNYDNGVSVSWPAVNGVC